MADALRGRSKMEGKLYRLARGVSRRQVLGLDDCAQAKNKNSLTPSPPKSSQEEERRPRMRRLIRPKMMMECVPVIWRVMTGLWCVRCEGEFEKAEQPSRSAQADTRCTSSRPPADKVQGSHLIYRSNSDATHQSPSHRLQLVGYRSPLVFLNRRRLG